MRRRYVRSDSDLPDHDLILELSGALSGLSCHVRHYVHEGAHLVIAGRLDGGVSPVVNAASVAREVAEVVVPPGQEFAMVAYAPQPPPSGKPHFHDARLRQGERHRRQAERPAARRSHVTAELVAKDEKPGRLSSGDVELAYTPFHASWLNRIEAQFKALRYFTLNVTDHPDHATQARLIRRYIGWRNRHAADPRLHRVVNTANVA
jgi:transposase